jgi:hypothetical protein
MHESARDRSREFDFDHTHGLKRDLIADLGTWASSPARRTW